MKHIIYKNIIASTLTSVIEAADSQSVKSLLICNTSDLTAYIDLKLEHIRRKETDATLEVYSSINTYYILRQFNMASGVTLILEENELEYDFNNYHLKIYSTQTVDIIIK